MKKIVLMGITGIVLFAASVFGLLAVQGRLNHEGTKGLPLIGSFFPPPPKAPSEDAEPPAKDPSEDQTGDQGQERHASPPVEEKLTYKIGHSLLGTDKAPKDPAHPVPLAEGEAPQDEAAGRGVSSKWEGEKKSGHRKAYRPSRLFDFPTIEAGFSVDELNRIVARARTAEQAAAVEKAALEKRKADLDAREADIKAREEEVLAKIRQVEDLRGELDGRIEEFHHTVTMIRTDELKVLKADAKSLASFEPSYARDLVLQWWKTDKGQQRAIKVLNVMSPDAANAILQVMEVSQAREIMDRRGQAVQQPAPDKRK